MRNPKGYPYGVKNAENRRLRNKFAILIPTGKNSVMPDFKEVDMSNRILRHENKADRDICLRNGMWYVRLCNQRF